MSTESADHIRRWITADCGFRILVARSTETVTAASQYASALPAITDVFGRLLTGTVLLQLAQAPIDRVQCAMYHDGTAGLLLADVSPGPSVRGHIAHPRPTEEPYIGGGGRIQLSRLKTRGKEDLFTSIVPLPDDGGADVASALQRYTLDSEQVLTFISLATVIEPDSTVLRSGGLLVQALPEMRHQHLEAMTSCLEKTRFDSLIRDGADPFEAATELFADLSIHAIGRDPLTYRCGCSRAVAVAAVMTLNSDEIDEIRGGGSETVTCEFCGCDYIIRAADLLVN